MTPTQETVSLPGGMVTVQWRRSQRARRVSLRIDPRLGAVVVTLPNRAGQAAGRAMLDQHADWVHARLTALPAALALADGAAVPIAGVPHRIRHVPGARGGAWIEAGAIVVTGEPAFLPRRVADLLRDEARRRLTPMTQATAARIGLKPRRVVCKDTRTRWGSCSADGVIMLSWRLLMAPDFVQDYVVAHEVAHLRHMNHGPSFWALVRNLTPHADTGPHWLDRAGAGLLRVQ